MTGPYKFLRYEVIGDSGWWDCPPGHWCAVVGVKEPALAPTQLSVFLCCPVCKLIAGLPHQVDAGGNVTPSIVCPHSPCPMHLAPVTLDGWSHGEKARER